MPDLSTQSRGATLTRGATTYSKLS